VIKKVNLSAAFTSFDQTWEPRIAATVDDHDVKLVKLDGEFHWHAHDDADELFFVVTGHLRIELHDTEDLQLEVGDLVVIPAGVEHRPVASSDCQVVLIERWDREHR
jgi:mannose-6-phosphate isomerase-like protein (cupin superfamily)